MIKATVNGNTYEVEDGQVNGQLIDCDLVPIGTNRWHAISGNQSKTIELVNLNSEEKQLHLKIDGRNYHVQIADQYDLLLKKLGMSNMSQRKVAALKAPMPGLVLRMEKAIGDEVAKGDALLVLEAMKMENIIKAPGDGKIKAIEVKTGDAVEKGQLMVLFE